MLNTKTPKATVGGLSPSKGYTVQIFELTGSGNILLARREFVSKSTTPLGIPASGVSVHGTAGGAEHCQELGWESQAWVRVLAPHAAAWETSLQLLTPPPASRGPGPTEPGVRHCGEGSVRRPPKPLLPPWVVGS